MLKKISVMLPLLALVACQEKSDVVSGSVAGLSASVICSGTTIAGISGTANCSGPDSVAEGFYVMSAREDNSTLAITAENFLDIDFLTGREVATFKNAREGSPLYTDNYSVIPRPLDESDGQWKPCVYKGDWSCDTSDVPEYQERRHYLETIVAAKMIKDGEVFSSRKESISVCGISGSIEARIEDCRTKNGNWAFYNGSQYGQIGEGDWSQVSVVVGDEEIKYEVWRDERTKLLWSDKAASGYNWFQAAGYSKPTSISVKETNVITEPGVFENSAPLTIERTLQPANPISVCPDVVDGKIAAGGGTEGYTYENPESAFKGNLSIADKVIWKLPSIYDFKLADVNGIRKVLPNMATFWSSTSHSNVRYSAWTFFGSDGQQVSDARFVDYSVRCVGLVVD